MPWPCEPARAEFLEFHGGPRPTLFCELADYFDAAVDDHLAITGTLPDGLHQQIVLWARDHFPKRPTTKAGFTVAVPPERAGG